MSCGATATDTDALTLQTDLTITKTDGKTTVVPSTTNTYTVTGTVSSTATGTLVNTATVITPAGIIDPTPANNTATDTDTLTPQSDLTITKTDGKTSIVPGATNVYTIVVSNVGPSQATGVTISDIFASTFTNVTYTAVATGGASGLAQRQCIPITRLCVARRTCDRWRLSENR